MLSLLEKDLAYPFSELMDVVILSFSHGFVSVIRFLIVPRRIILTLSESCLYDYRSPQGSDLQGFALSKVKQQ